MMKSLRAAGLAAAFLGLSGATALAGPIEKACLKSDNGAANSSLCGCIQQVADWTLPGSDQRRAAKFFKNPDEAHSAWLSQSGKDDAFWERYETFGSTAEVWCGGASGI